NAKMKRLIAIAFGMVATVWLSVANADLLYTAGSGTTLFDFVCFSSKHCPVHVNVNSAGTEMGTSSNPFIIDTPNSGNLFGAATSGVAANGATYPASSVGFGWKDGSGNIQPAAAATPLPVQTSADPCASTTKTNFTISTTSGTVQLVAPSGSTQVYICSLITIGATASIQNLVGGTASGCTTGTPVA